MSREYAMSRVRDALEKSEGNVLKAQRLVMTWLEKDHTLLIGLAGPHLQSIVSHAVNHAAAPEKPVQVPKPKRVGTAAIGSSVLGEALIESMQGKSAKFGEEDPSTLSRPGRASQKHVDAINALAAKGKGGKKK